MERDAFEERGFYKDKRDFTDAFDKITTQPELEGFIASCGLDNFNSILKNLDADQYKKVVGRTERIRLGLTKPV